MLCRDKACLVSTGAKKAVLFLEFLLFLYLAKVLMVRINVHHAQEIEELIPQCNSHNFQILLCYNNEKYYPLSQELNEQTFHFIQKQLEAKDEKERIEAAKVAFEAIKKVDFAGFFNQILNTVNNFNEFNCKP